MDPIPLTEELFKKLDHTALKHLCPWSLPFSFIAVGQIGRWHILVFVTGTPYAQIPAMPAYMPVESFDAFPEELHVCRETHVALVACGIGHTDVKVIKIRFLVWSQDLLEGINLKTGCYLITDGTDYLEVGYGKRRVYHDSAEHLVVYVAVEMFHQLPVGESGVCLRTIRAIFAQGLKMFLWPRRCSDRPAAFAIHSNGNTEWSLPSSLSLKLLRYFFRISNSLLSTKNGQG